MGVREFFDVMAAGNHRLQRRGVEQHGPDPLSGCANAGLPFAAQAAVAYVEVAVHLLIG